MSKSRKQKLITKEHIARHTNWLNLYFSMYFGSKLLKSSTYKVVLITVKHYRPVFFYKLCYLHGMPTEALHLVSNVQLVKWLLL